MVEREKVVLFAIKRHAAEHSFCEVGVGGGGVLLCRNSRIEAQSSTTKIAEVLNQWYGTAMKKLVTFPFPFFPSPVGPLQHHVLRAPRYN